MSTRDEVQPVTDPYQFAAPYAWILEKDGKPQGIPIAHRPSDWPECERVWGATFTPLYPRNTLAGELLEAQWRDACGLAQDYCQRRGLREYGRSAFEVLVEDADRMADRIRELEAASGEPVACGCNGYDTVCLAHSGTTSYAPPSAAGVNSHQSVPSDYPSAAGVQVTEAMVKAREALLLAADLLRDAIISEDGLDAADAVHGVDTALDAVRLLEGVGAVDPHSALTAASEVQP